MIDLSTGKQMTRREAVKGLAGLAGIIAAGKAPAAVVRSMLGAKGVAFGKSLPYDEEVEYLESHGLEYIELPSKYSPSNTYASVVTGRILSITGVKWPAICGWDAGGIICKGVYTNVSDAVSDGNGGIKLSFSTNRTVSSVIDYGLSSNTTTSCNGMTITRKHPSLESYALNTGYILFGCASQGSVMMSISIVYSFTQSINGVPSFDLHPVVKSNIGYMHDRISNRLYGNASGQGAFTWG